VPQVDCGTFLRFNPIEKNRSLNVNDGIYMLINSVIGRFVCVVIAVCISGMFSNSAAQFKSVKTDDLNLLYYDFGHEYLINHTVRSFRNALNFHRTLFDYNLSEPVTLIMQDFGDFGNAGASAVPQNVILMGIAPFHYAYETNPANERINVLMNHELVHIVALDKASKTDRIYRNMFMGKVDPAQSDPISMFYGYLTTPRRYSPRWYHEGIAEFLTTWMSGGIGRVMGAYDEMMFRTMVRDGAHIYDAIGLESEGTTIDFQVGSHSYMYGTRFMSYLALQYGPESLIEWTARSDDSKRFFSRQFKNVYGNSLNSEWTNWVEWEREWQQGNLERIRSNPVTVGKPLSRTPLGAISRAIYDDENNRIFVAVAYPGQVAHIAILNPDDGTMRRLADIEGPALYFVSSLAYDPETATLFYTNNNNGWRDLYSVDVNSGRTRLLVKGVRTGDLAFNSADKSLWGIRHFNGIVSIVRIQYPYTDWNRVHSMRYGDDIFDIDLSPDGELLTAAIGDVSGNQKLVMMKTADLLNGEFKPDEIFDFAESSPAGFSFSPDGQFLFGSTYYSGVSNIVRYELETEEIRWLTNAETGLFKPIPVWQDSLIAFEYTGEGFMPIKIANEPVERVSAIQFLGQQIVENHPIVINWMLEPPSPHTVDMDTLIRSRSEYSSIQNLQLSSAYPILQGYKDYAAVGLRADFSDPLRLHKMSISASWSPSTAMPDNERFHASFNYSIPSWRFFANYNAADFYDLFGPTKTSRKGYSVGVGYNTNLIYDVPRMMDLNITTAYYGGMERLPEFQNIVSSFDSFLSLNARLSYQSTLFSLGAVDHEKGIRWELMSSNNYVEQTLFPRVNQNLDYGIALPFKHSSIWLRSSVGYSFSPRREPLGNFYFGGFGNNWIDYQTSRRYRSFYSFPGAELNEIGGTNFGKILAEWTLPPIRFKKAGFTNLYANWAQLNLFSSGLITNMDSSEFLERYYNVGAQLDVRLAMFSILESTFSVGYASAWNDITGSRGDELMISLRLMR